MQRRRGDDLPLRPADRAPVQDAQRPRRLDRRQRHGQQQGLVARLLVHRREARDRDDRGRQPEDAVHAVRRHDPDRDEGRRRARACSARSSRRWPRRARPADERRPAANAQVRDHLAGARRDRLRRLRVAPARGAEGELHGQGRRDRDPAQRRRPLPLARHPERPRRSTSSSTPARPASRSRPSSRTSSASKPKARCARARPAARSPAGWFAPTSRSTAACAPSGCAWSPCPTSTARCSAWTCSAACTGSSRTAPCASTCAPPPSRR